jgi:hypothetical protein
MESCSTCELRHCNGCRFDPTKKVERKPEVFFKETKRRWPFEEVPYSKDFTFSFKDQNGKPIDGRIFIVDNNDPCFVTYNYNSDGVFPSIEDTEPKLSFNVSTERYDFRMYVCKKTIWLEEVHRLGFDKTCELLSLFFLGCIDRELGDKQEIFPVKEFKNQVDTRFGIYDDSITFILSTYVGVKNE